MYILTHCCASPEDALPDIGFEDLHFTFSKPEYLYIVQGARGRRLTQSAIIIQSAFRCMAAKRHLAQARKAATAIQAAFRAHQGRRQAQQVGFPISLDLNLPSRPTL